MFSKRNSHNLKLKNKLRKFRCKHNKITQQELANELGVTRLTIHSIETGKFTPSAALALKIAQFFKVPFEDIFYFKKE